MPQSQTTCPQCKQPVIVEIQQLFDVSQDPLAKQKLLSNASNFLRCPSCGYQGLLAIPLVYHDPEKELLLTFFPPDLRTSVNEQEKQIGPLINRILENLPQEKRKAYLLQPKSMLTYQTLIETILEADGITKEMLEEQQKRIKLLERLLTTPKTERVNIIKQEEELIDVQFFSIFTRILQTTNAQGDQKSQQELIALQEELFKNTKTGQEIFTQAKETETAIKALQEAGKEGLTREKLLDAILKANSEIQLSTIVGMARAGLDYEFFKLLSERIEKESSQQEKEKLLKLREKLLQMTEKIDQRIKEELDQAKTDLEKIIGSPNIEAALQENLGVINDFFVQTLELEISSARKKGDLDRINKLEQVMVFIEKISQPTEEVKLIEKLLEVEDEAQLEKILQENQEKINQDFLGLVNSVVAQAENQNSEPGIVEKLKRVYKAVLRFSMRTNLSK